MKSIFFMGVLLFCNYTMQAQKARVHTDTCFKSENNETVTQYIITADNSILNTWQDVANLFIGKVPGVQVSLDQFGQIEQLRIRNQDTDIVYIDGVRTSIEALQMLNPADIECIKVLPNTNYIPNSN